MIKSTFSKIEILLVFIGITSIGLLTILLIILLLHRVLLIFGINVDYWVAVEAISTAITAAAVLGAGFVAYKELSEASTIRHLGIANQLFQELNSKENIEARRWIFQNLSANPEEGLTKLDDQGRTAIKSVLNSMDHIAFLTQAGWIPVNLVMPWMHPMIAKSWEKLKPYVEYERIRRNEPYYYKYAEQIGIQCLHWRQQNLIDNSKTSWIDNAI